MVAKTSFRRSLARLTAVLALAALGFGSTSADAADQDFGTWLAGFRADALARGIRAQTLDSAFAGVAPIPRVVELDRRQPEFSLSFTDYMARVVSTARVERGRDLMTRHASLLAEVGQRYGVQPRFVVALWGIESDFGRLMGTFQVVPALATLAYDGRRATYFRGELMNALTIIDRGHITADRMLGSWAGAMGQAQFMPSSFLSYAVDYDGDGRADIWTTVADVFASAANYLSRSGWRNDQTWGREVQLPANFDRSRLGLNNGEQLSLWQEMGVRRSDGGELPKRPMVASIVEAEAGKGPTFVVYDNFRTILKWNRSTFFAIAVGTLADRIGDS